MFQLSLSQTQSRLEREVTEIQFTRPCFCCKVHFNTFFMFFNLLHTIGSLILTVIFIWLLVRNIIFISAIIAIIFCKIHFIFANLSMLVYFRTKDIASVVQKWQGILFLFLACLYCALFVVYFFLLSLVSLGQINIGDSIVVIDLYLALVILLPVVGFNLYWTLMYMQMIAVQFQINNILDEEASVERDHSNIKDVSIDVS